MPGQHAQVFHDQFGIWKDVSINPLQDDLAAGIGGHDKSIVYQSLPMRVDGADFSVQDKLAGNVLLMGHDGKAMFSDVMMLYEYCTLWRFNARILAFDGQACAALG